MGLAAGIGLGSLWMMTSDRDSITNARYHATADSLRSRETPSPSVVVSLQDPSDQQIVDLRFSPNGKMLATGNAAGLVRLWDIASGRLLKTWSGHTKEVTGVAFAPDGKTLVSSSSDGTARVWHLDKGKSTTTLRAHGDFIAALAFSPDGQTLATGGADNTVRLWNTTTWRAKRTLQGDPNPEAREHPPIELLVSAVAFSPDGKWLAEAHSVTYDGEPSRSADYITLWDTRRWKAKRALTYFEQVVDSVTSMAFSPNSQQLAAGYNLGYAVLFDLATGQPRPTPDFGSNLKVEFASGGRVLLGIGFHERNVILWDTVAKKEIGSLTVPSPTTGLATSPKGDLLAVGGVGGKVTVWDLSNLPAR